MLRISGFKKKRICTMLCISCVLLSACSRQSSSSSTQQSTEMVSEEASTDLLTVELIENNTDNNILSAPDKASPDVPDGTPIKHEFQTYVYNDFYDEYYSEETKNVFYAYCDALMRGDSELHCTDVNFDTVRRVKLIAGDLMPVAVKHASIKEISTSDGVANIEYDISKEEYLEELEVFKSNVTQILDDTCKAGYTDLEKTLALYDYFVHNYTYDETYTCHTSYGLLTDGSGCGICEDIAGAFIYLLNQAGVEAFCCYGLTENNNGHVWSIVKIDGKYYHIDPTFGIDEPDSLKFFGMTDERRIQEGFSEDWRYSNGEIPNLDNRFSCIDDRFLLLSDSKNCEIDFDNDVIYYNSGSSDEVKEFHYNEK